LASQGIELIGFRAADGHSIPLPDQSVDAVSMLAVFEHIPLNDLQALLNEIARVLRPGGLWVMTTPAGWTGPILAAMSRLNLVSGDEIGEHQDSYSRAKIRKVLNQTAMRDWSREFGSFELGMNTWVRVTKPTNSSAGY
jgi:ubiquinone/menaquinone biosynthesis C-methylase UbiE